jgi:hypothetical protein
MYDMLSTLSQLRIFGKINRYKTAKNSDHEDKESNKMVTKHRTYSQLKIKAFTSMKLHSNGPILYSSK